MDIAASSGLSISGWWFKEHLDHIVPYIGNFMIPTDELILFRGVGISPTRYYSILFPYKC